MSITVKFTSPSELYGRNLRGDVLGAGRGWKQQYKPALYFFQHTIEF